MRNIGICFGGYCPMHKGHLDLIMRAKKENDVCYVVSCGFEQEPRGVELGLGQEDRYKLVKEFFKDDPSIIVLSANDTKIGIDQSMSIYNWRHWLIYVMEKIHERGPKTFYVSEPEYEKSIKSVYPKFNVVLMNKEKPISGTLIRKNPLRYWNSIVSTYKPALTKKILITGTASEGKSTLVKDLRKYFDLTGAEEFGRLYMEERNMKDTDLGLDEFKKFILGQHNLIQKAIRDPGNKGIIISDTDSLVTLMYAKAYISDPNIEGMDEEKYKELKRFASNFIGKWDMIFMLTPSKHFFDDGLRYMKQSTMEERNKNIEILKSLMSEFGYSNYVELNGTYYENYEQVKKYIEQEFNR